MTITDYKIIKHSTQNISILEEEVNQLINIGWQPIGEAKIILVDKQQVIIQQMTKE